MAEAAPNALFMHLPPAHRVKKSPTRYRFRNQCRLRSAEKPHAHPESHPLQMLGGSVSRMPVRTAMSNKPEKVVLALLRRPRHLHHHPWLKKTIPAKSRYGRDVGQGDDIEAIIKKAYDTGANKS